MAKLKIGEGVSLEAQLPQAQNPIEETSSRRIDIVSDRLHYVDEKVSSFENQISSLSDELEKANDDILQLGDIVNKIDMSPSKTIVTPEVKQITLHKNHTKDFEDVYQKIFDNKMKLKGRIEQHECALETEIKKQKNINIALSIVIVGSILLHLF